MMMTMMTTKEGANRDDKARWVERPLTARQLEVARLVALDFSNKKIAADLGVKEQTVKNLVSEITGRLGVTTRVGIALWIATNHPTIPTTAAAIADQENRQLEAERNSSHDDGQTKPNIIDFKRQQQRKLADQSRPTKTG